MLVVVLPVRRMPAPVVHVVDVIRMRNRDVPTAIPMDVVVLFVDRVARRLALVVMVVVPSMEVAVVRVIDVVAVWDGDVAASFAVHVFVLGVFVMGCAGHCYHRRADRSS